MKRSKNLLDLRPNAVSVPSKTDPSGLQSRCFVAASTAFEDLTGEHLRILISQEIELDVTLPLALNHLDENLLLSGDMFLGDLLLAVSRIPAGTLPTHPGLQNQLRNLMDKTIELSETLTEQVIPNFKANAY